MLYESWHNTVDARRNDLALRDLASGRRWTFAQLFAAGEARRTDPEKSFARKAIRPSSFFRCCPRGVREKSSARSKQGKPCRMSRLHPKTARI